MDAPNAIDQKEQGVVPSMIAWTRFCENAGLQLWSEGLRDAVVGLVVTVNPQLHAQHQMLAQQGMSPSAFEYAVNQLLGGNPRGGALQKLAQAFSNLRGIMMLLRTGAAPSSLPDQGEISLCPQPAALFSIAGYQLL